MKRGLFNFLAAVSLVMCVATVVLWVRSNCGVEAVTYNRLDATKLRYSSCGLQGSQGFVVDYYGEDWSDTQEHFKQFVELSHTARQQSEGLPGQSLRDRFTR